MKKIAFAAAFLAAAAFSGSAFSANFTHHVKVSHCHARYAAPYQCGNTHIYVSRTCPEGACPLLNRLWWPY